MGKYYRGRTATGAFHMSTGPKHSSGKVSALCGAMILLDSPLFSTDQTTCVRCMKKKEKQ